MKYILFILVIIALCYQYYLLGLSDIPKPIAFFKNHEEALKLGHRIYDEKQQPQVYFLPKKDIIICDGMGPCFMLSDVLKLSK